MGIFRADKEKNKLALVFDIGSSSVGGALFYMQDSGFPNIIFSIRQPITLEADINVDRFFILTIKALEIVANRICMAGMGAPHMIFCVLSSPWYVSQNRIMRLKKNAPFIFTSKLADELIQKELALFKEEHLQKYTNIAHSIRPIEFKNIKTSLNGYETLSPLNQKAKELEMSIFVSMSEEQVLGKIEETIKKNFQSKEIKFSSFVMASFAVVRDMYINQENFLLIDIGGEVTDISMVKKNVLREATSFPLGSNFLIRGVASAFACSLGEAKSYLSLFKDEHAEKSVLEKLEAIINKLRTEWLLKFQDSLARLTSDISVPATIYMAVDKEFAEFFSEIIKNEQFNQYTLTESKFKIIFLSTEIFHGMAVFKEDVIRDSFLIIDSVYINRFLK
ncbi:hypothetical protein A2818_00345 [Candidatus Nomurabacteria bacterium RIFCSPHIGHO2_01_FULL_40_12]|uniref:SHS2 domain-containing protein n=1 Tax=Candidatus Nomurabacteria bacterium RIFCSPHIGHO2_01_FULL_40_12 TaxID=1801737 RepID=A0A1F6UZT0_9BACT|nr:MAG: hypothetical protein A2818_00345 [Candidatus Nomurabacteria bacterium RIFCSPHIGHO2_01_FULL_40_12]